MFSYSRLRHFALTVTIGLPRRSSSSSTREILRLGAPRSGPLLLVSPGHVLGYDPLLKVARWVCERLVQDGSGSARAHGRRPGFRADPRLSPQAAARPFDLRGSGLNRGHLAAAANATCRRSLQFSFLMSNVVAQPAAVNGGVWRRLEGRARALAASGPVWVTSGPLFVPRAEADGSVALHVPLVGAGRLPVPTHLFKLLVYPGKGGRLTSEAYVVRNGPENGAKALRECTVTVEELERLSGLRLLPRVRRSDLHQLTAADL
ncbi:endonuclease G, mitochondrial-like [Amphibalanus amphitrite]|uniref:endonuclease G, mitochondrial-like n=1 Tax=Amphibalanus amphitrite TaxID=1232801 RepID=UPI001C9257B0|nr:endonuclease G, mitochondrial-like [Amphibalanus amphitrite]